MQRQQKVEDISEPFMHRKKLEYGARSQIRKQSLDPYNRLHSIAEDIDFVQSVHERYTGYPLLANLRCGAWYCGARSIDALTAHFKSADGHYNGWSFNLRRPNLHILPLLREAGGICLVDSTRTGKRMPDSLSKTVPIWCTIINRALKLRGTVRSNTWDIQLYTPPQSVSKQEHIQIESMVDGWAESLATSSYELASFDKPLRPIWITPAATVLPTFDTSTPFFPIICISASKVVEDGGERRRNGYSYVQGAGDDHENWSNGLTPDIFLTNKDELLNASEADFSDVLESIVFKGLHTARSFRAWDKRPTPINHVGGLLSICALADIPEMIAKQLTIQEPSDEAIASIFIRMSVKGTKGPANDGAISHRLLYQITIPSDKKSGGHAFKACLPGFLRFIRQHLREGRQVCIACETGKDLSVGVVLAALQAHFDDDGVLEIDQFERGRLNVTKESLRTRLHWIIASRPEANPSRATLKRINEFFMSPHCAAR